MMEQRPLPVHKAPADNYIENKSGGTVNIFSCAGRPEKPPAQSKGDPKSIRFLPEDKNNFQRAANAERVSFNEYIERCGKIGVPYSLEEVDALIENSAHIRTLLLNWKILHPLLVKLSDE